MVQSGAYCENYTLLNNVLGHGFGSKEDCAQIMPSVKGKHSCSSTSGFFDYSELGDVCSCAKDDCDKVTPAGNYTIYRMIGKNVFPSFL